jgi:hypothetical protein
VRVSHITLHSSPNPFLSATGCNDGNTVPHIQPSTIANRSASCARPPAAPCSTPPTPPPRRPTSAALWPATHAPDASCAACHGTPSPPFPFTLPFPRRSRPPAAGPPAVASAVATLRGPEHMRAMEASTRRKAPHTSGRKRPWSRVEPAKLHSTALPARTFAPCASPRLFMLKSRPTRP